MTSGHDSSLEKLFESAASLVQSSSSEAYMPDDAKLKLYGLYKRCTTGRVSESDSPEPAMWNIVANRKRNAWRECDDLDLGEAMERYVQTVSELDNETGLNCSKLWNDHLSKIEGRKSEGPKETEMIDTIAVTPNTKTQQQALLAAPPAKQSLFQKLTGIKPFVPRGELDITYSDLSHALLQCIKPSIPFLEAPMRATIRLEEEISQAWNEYTSSQSEVLTGLSVRSLLDLYLSSKSYPKGSEVIIVPPIGIEGMMDVIQYHEYGLKIVPVDIDDYENGGPVIHVDIDRVKQKMNRNTVAVLIVHPFGLVCMNEEEMRTLRHAVDEYDVNSNIEIWEDCAECFTGNYGYRGSKHANVLFFSFGIIKTATALGGGICVLNERLGKSVKATSEKMKRIHHMRHGQQTGREYFIKICKVFLLHIFSRNSSLLGVMLWILALFRVDYDEIITSAVKGFPAQHMKSCAEATAKQLNEQKRARASKLFQRLRKRPCPALLSLLHRRLRGLEVTSKTVTKRVERCTKMTELLQEYLPSVELPRGSDGSQHLYWLFPFITSDPDGICRAMKEFGYDVPRGTSQLACVTNFLVDSDEYINSCPNTLRMMKHILYLPIASRDMSESDMRRIVTKLRLCSRMSNGSRGENRIPKSNGSRGYPLSICVLLIAATRIILDARSIQMLPLSSSISCLARIFRRQLLPVAFGIICLICIALHLLRMTMGGYYMNCSKAFSKYNSIMSKPSMKQEDFNEKVSALDDSGASVIDDTQLHSQNYDLKKHHALELPLSKSGGNADGNQALLAGATGFIGSLLLRELLLYRERLSIEGGVVLICRSKRNMTAQQRVDDLLSKEMFSFLNQEDKETLVTVIEGDLSCPSLGMSDDDYHRVCNELNITHIINSAACVNFTEPLQSAAESNITSALQLQALAKSIKIKRAKYVYLSTAFVHGSKTGSTASPLPENLFDFGKYDPKVLYESMMDTQSCASAAMHDLGFPNTYTFSKSICEHLLMRDKGVRTIIIRPCIVGPAVQVPYEGWAGDKPSTIVAGACLYLKNPYNLWSFRRERAAVIPVDVVCRFILAKAFNEPSDEQSSSSDDDGTASTDSTKSTMESYHSSEQSYFFAKDTSSSREDTLQHPGQRQNEAMHEEGHIYTAAWNSLSPASTGFQWYGFACAVVQLGSARGHVEKTVAYFVLLVSFKIFLAIDLTLETFRKMHSILVHWPLLSIEFICRNLGLKPKCLRDFDKLRPFLDLPLLFFPFTSATFQFDSGLQAPTQFNAERYMFSCVLAAEKFVASLNQRNAIKHIGKERKSPSLSVQNSGYLTVAGKMSAEPLSDLLWCMMQPCGNYAIRLGGWVVIKLLRAVTTEVTVDVESFMHVARAVEESQALNAHKDGIESKTFVILAPTHRSFLDFMILSFVSFALPETGLAIPRIAAADDFSRLPVLGSLAKMAGAFFLRRGKGVADPALRAQVHSLKERHSDANPTCIEVFLEGRRSRDRRFVSPKTGFLR